MVVSVFHHLHQMNKLLWQSEALTLTLTFLHTGGFQEPTGTLQELFWWFSTCWSEEMRKVFKGHLKMHLFCLSPSDAKDKISDFTSMNFILCFTALSKCWNILVLNLWNICDLFGRCCSVLSCKSIQCLVPDNKPINKSHNWLISLIGSPHQRGLCWKMATPQVVTKSWYRSLSLKKPELKPSGK